MKREVVIGARGSCPILVGRTVPSRQRARAGTVLAAIAFLKTREIEIGAWETALRATGAWDGVKKDFGRAARTLRDTLVKAGVLKELVDPGAKTLAALPDDVVLVFGTSPEEEQKVLAQLEPFRAFLTDSGTMTAAEDANGPLTLAPSLKLERHAIVIFRYGDILSHGNADLTLLPSSAKGGEHITPHAMTRVTQYKLSLPVPKSPGGIEVHPFPGPGTLTKFYAWAASVFNKSTPEMIATIGRNVGEYVSSHDGIRVVESPLLGAGSGRVDPVVAGMALRRGFLDACRVASTLFVYTIYDGTLAQLQAAARREEGALSG